MPAAAVDGVGVGAEGGMARDCLALVEVERGLGIACVVHMVQKLLIVFSSTFKLPKIVLQNTQHFACHRGKARKEGGGRGRGKGKLTLLAFIKLFSRTLKKHCL